MDEVVNSNVPKRHGCLTTYLVLILFGVVFNFVGLPLLEKAAKTTTGSETNLLMMVTAIASLICAIGLFKWKKWGFYGYAAVQLVSMVASIINHETVLQLAVGIAAAPVTIGLLYWVLDMGGENKAWPHLK